MFNGATSLPVAIKIFFDLTVVFSLFLETVISVGDEIYPSPSKDEILFFLNKNSIPLVKSETMLFLLSIIFEILSFGCFSSIPKF